jgi:uncharacterized protein YqgC (DUF456 family)
MHLDTLFIVAIVVGIPLSTIVAPLTATVTTISIPTSTIVEAERIAAGSIAGMIRRNLKIEIAYLILVTHSSSTHCQRHNASCFIFM